MPEGREWYYTELPKGVYRATLRQHHWPGVWLFQALPDSGGGCWEFKSENYDLVLEKALAFVGGNRAVDGIYFSSL
jgi:hypothetical protein